MRRFIKTFTVKKHTQFTVVQDGDLKAFVILRWDAGKTGPEQVGEPFGYESWKEGDSPQAKEAFRSSVDAARAKAVGAARQLAAEAGQTAQLGEEPELSAEEAEAEDERAAAAAQALSPAAQEARRR